MNIFSIHALRRHIKPLLQNTKCGRLKLITKKGRPIFIAVPFNDDLFGILPATNEFLDKLKNLGVKLKT